MAKVVRAADGITGVGRRISRWATALASGSSAALRERTRRALRVLFRISGQLYGGIGVAVALTFVASLSAWFAFNIADDAQSRVNERSVPQLAASFAVAQQGGALSVAASRLTVAATPRELAEVDASVVGQRQSFEVQLLELTSQSGERFDRVRAQGGALVTNIDAIKRSAEERFELAEQGAALRERLTALDENLQRLLIPATGKLRQDAASATHLLANAMTVPDAASLESLKRRFETVVRSIRRNAPAGGRAARDRASAFARLSDLGLARGGVFDLRAEELDLIQHQQALLTDNRNFAADLLAEIEGLVSAAQDGAASATRASENAIATGRTLLVAINGVSIVGAVLVAWLLVGRILLRRLQRLSDRMRAMADGDLEAEVDIRGRDEVADMAAALEVFRRHALEVQRLNLVEKLAEELRGKNEQLEATLEELHHAQNQIVAREKLAGLGELTAGVAHEISNPLNFVNNYSEASGELLAELNEELEDGGHDFSETQKELVGEFCEDLVGNIERIRRHGERATRIVSDMLKMGGGTGERRLTDINHLLRDQVAVVIGGIDDGSPDLRLDVEWDLDPKAGRVEVVPQDIGRVFQNLVANARDATEERRRADGEGGTYAPALLIATERFADRLEVRIRDNGTGIPPDVVDKIFNPFFTTKPTDQGTGLGLSLCNDILRGHGGDIRVETEAGSHTEMIVEIPIRSTPAAEPPPA